MPHKNISCVKVSSLRFLIVSNSRPMKPNSNDINKFIQMRLNKYRVSDNGPATTYYKTDNILGLMRIACTTVLDGNYQRVARKMGNMPWKDTGWRSRCVRGRSPPNGHDGSD